MTLLFTACDSKRNQATFGNSQDTSSVNRGGGGSIADTATISAREKAGKQDSAKGDTTGKGNADPAGHMK